MKRFWSLLLLPLLCAATLADPVVQAPKEPVPANVPVGLRVTGGTDFVAHVLSDAASVEMGLLDDGATLVFFRAQAPGLYTVVVIAPDRTIGWCEVPVGDVNPPPPPPPPPPTDVVSVYWIEESNDSQNATAKVRDDKSWKDAAMKAGLRFEVGDDDKLEKTVPAAVKKAREVGMPAIMFLDKDAKVVSAHPAPATAAALKALVERKGAAEAKPAPKQ